MFYDEDIRPQHCDEEWHDWFAWYPIYTVEGKWVWLTQVFRRWLPIDYVWGCVDLSAWQYSNGEAIWKAYQSGSGD